MSSSSSTANPRVVSEETIGSGNWIALKMLRYVDPEGKERSYEVAQRTTRKGEVVDDFGFTRPEPRRSKPGAVEGQGA